MQQLGTSQLDRRTLLRRGAAFAGASAAASLLAVPSLASAGVDEDLAEVRLVCATKRVTIGWYTRWIDGGCRVGHRLSRALLMLRRQEQEHPYAFLSPLLGGTAPSDDLD